MAKLTLTDISSGYLSTTTFNANNTLIEAALENTLSRDGTSPNTMSANLDMNSNKIVNLTDPTSNQDAATKYYVDQVTGGIDTLAELTDVTSAATTNRFVLVADGSAYVGRVLTEADISDLGTYLTAVSEADVETALASATAFTANNYVFNVDQVVGAGTDNYVLTYDNATGEIGLEAAASGGIANVVEDTTPQLGGALATNGFNIQVAADDAVIWSDGTDTLTAEATTASGVLTFQPTGGFSSVDFNLAVTANSYDGISAANLVDKSAAETISGAWTFSGAGVYSTSLNAVPLARSVSATDNTATTDYGIIINLTGGTGQTFTLDADPPTNAVVMFDNSAGASWTIAASVSLIWAKDGTTGNRTLADDGIAVAKHRGSGTWIINGSAKLT